MGVTRHRPFRLLRFRVWPATAVLLGIAWRSAWGQSRAAPALTDPFRGVRPQHDHAVYAEHAAERRGTPLERRALAAAPLSGKGFEVTIVSRTLAGRPLVLVRGWHAEGTGLQELGYYVFAAVGMDSVRLVWSAVAEEAFNPGTFYESGKKIPGQQPPYDVRGCLYASGDGLLAYEAHGVPKLRADDDVPLPESGYYRWSETRQTFDRVRPSDAVLRARCRRERSLVLD